MNKENRAEPGSAPQNMREQADRIQAEKAAAQEGDSTGVGGNPSQ